MKQYLTKSLLCALMGTSLLLGGCGSDSQPEIPIENEDPTPPEPVTPPDPDKIAVQLDRPAWYDTNPETEQGEFRVVSEAHKLEFFGWSESQDKLFTLTFPQEPGKYRRALLSYRMGGWNQGPSDWDNTTMVFIKNKADGKWYELSRAFTPYGGGFKSDWNKTFYLDVTEYLPMLCGQTEFRLYYGGFDATETKAHTVTLGFDLFEGTPQRNVIFTGKVYDSSAGGNTGYRGWAYGVEGVSIEDDERLGLRTFEIPDAVKSIEMKVSISGHGHDLGDFPDRPNYRKNNAAEFVENTYGIRIDGTLQAESGRIFYSNADNYWQAGTYRYDRANWGPGNPLYVHYWSIDRSGAESPTLTIDLDLERFVSTMKKPNEEGVAQYIIEVDIFGYDK